MLNVLYSLIQKSRINEHIIATKQGKSEEEIAYVFSLSVVAAHIYSHDIHYPVKLSVNTAHAHSIACWATSASFACCAYMYY